MPERYNKTDAVPVEAASPFAQFLQANVRGNSYLDSMRDAPGVETDPDMTVVIPVIRAGEFAASQGTGYGDDTEVIRAINIPAQPGTWRPQSAENTGASAAAAQDSKGKGPDAVAVRNNAQVDRNVLSGQIDKPRSKFVRYGALALVAASAVSVGAIKFLGSDEKSPASATAMVGEADTEKLDPAKFVAPALECAKPGQLRTILSARAQSDILIPIDTNKGTTSLDKTVAYPMFKDGVNAAPEGKFELNNAEVCFDENKEAKQKNGTLKPFVTLAKDPKNKNEYIATIHRDLAIPVPKVPLGNCDTKDGNAVAVCVDDPGASNLQIGPSTAKGIDANEAKAANEFVRSDDYSRIAISSMQSFSLKRLTHAAASATEEEKKAAQVMRADIWKAFDAQLKNLAAPELTRYGVTNITFDGEYASLERDLYSQFKASIDDPRVIVDPDITSLTITSEAVK